MKKITKKSILQKITISILSIMLLFNFIVPTYSHADFGGVLLSPVVDLLCSIGDAVVNLLQLCMTGETGSKDVNFSMSAFLVEDDEFWANADGKYDKYIGAGGETTENINVEEDFEKGWFGISDKYHIPIATYSPEQIFAGKVAGLDINFINPNKYTNSDGEEVESSAAKLQPTIASWYVAIRNLAVVGLLSILVYVGIRIIISSTASDKAKYKQMLVDWLIALCILFFMHYLMSFIITMTESVCTAIAGDGSSNITVNVTDENGSHTFNTNLLGLARFKTQYKDFGPKMAYLIMYLALVIYTVVFTWFYLKRLLMMAFLTLIAPAVALTYPIDKMNDGKAQAFDAWLKEYAFNALIQPFHLIIYYVFVTSAMDLASTNIIYMIAALAFIMPAEKILRKFFGFDKAGAGTLGALAGGLTAGSLISKLGKGKSHGGSSGKASGGNSVESGEKPVRFEKKHDVGQIEGGRANSEGATTNADESENEDYTQDALDKYSADGYGQNANGEYFNPWTDEYDANYDPTKDAAYMAQQQDNQEDNSTDGQANSIENDDKDDKKEKNPNMFQNWTRAHGITLGSVAKGAGRSITGAAKFATRTAFKAGAGTLAGAVTLASGGGFAGASAAFVAGSNLGGRLGDKVVNAGSYVGRGVGRVGKAFYADATAANGKEGLKAAENALLGGTKLGKELDLAHGNTRYQDATSAKQFKTDKNNLQYLRDQMAAQNGGVAPTSKEIKDKMNSFDPYLSEGMKDIKEMLKAQKAEQYGISSKQAAIIAAIGKEKGITADVLNDDKKAKAQQANLRQEFINKGQSEESATRQADYTINVLKAQNGVAHNLKKTKNK